MASKSILIIDDEFLMLDLVEECLSEDFSTIVKCNTPDKARDLLLDRQYDCILIDIDLAGVNGAEIIKFVNDYDPGGNKDTPIVIMSGHINDAFADKFKDKFAGIIAKPFKPTQIQAKVLIALGKSKRKPRESNLNLFEDKKQETTSNKSDVFDLPSGDQAKKIEIEFENETIEMDIYNPSVVAPYKIQDLSKKVSSFLNKVKKNNKLNDLFKDLRTVSKESYLMRHIELLINISTGLAQAMDWGSESTLEKFIFASYLHDLSLGVNNELAKFKHVKEFEANDSLSEETKKLIRFHPLASKKLIEYKSDIPQDVHAIIEQHHEMPDGSGFPHGIDHKRITPLSSVFIVSHLLADFICENDKWKIDDFISQYHFKMKGPHFRKLMKCLEKLK